MRFLPDAVPGDVVVEDVVVEAVVTNSREVAIVVLQGRELTVA
jgi:hypothetical protein